MLFEFQCGVCEAHYRIEGDRISDAGVKITCPRCNNFFILRRPVSGGEKLGEAQIEYLAIRPDLAPKPISGDSAPPKIAPPPPHAPEPKPTGSTAPAKIVMPPGGYTVRATSQEKTPQGTTLRPTAPGSREYEESLSGDTDASYRPSAEAGFTVTPYTTEDDHRSNPYIKVPKELQMEVESASHVKPRPTINLTLYVSILGVLLAILMVVMFFKGRHEPAQNAVTSGLPPAASPAVSSPPAAQPPALPPASPPYPAGKK